MFQVRYSLAVPTWCLPETWHRNLGSATDSGTEPSKPIQSIESIGSRLHEPLGDLFPVSQWNDPSMLQPAFGVNVGQEWGMQIIANPNNAVQETSHSHQGDLLPVTTRHSIVLWRTWQEIAYTVLYTVLYTVQTRTKAIQKEKLVNILKCNANWCAMPGPRNSL